MGKDLKGKELGKGISQRKDGRYCARFVNRFGVRQSLYGDSIPELKRNLKEAQRQDIARTNFKKSYTLDEWYERWIDVYKYHVRISTRSLYAQTYRLHISPILGKQQLTQITALSIRSLINDMDRDGYHYETKNKVKSILADMFGRAIEDDLVFKNPASGIHIARDEKNPKRVLTVDEQVEFFNACKGTFFEEAYTVQILTGLRSGELFALNPWKDIDFERHEIHVRHTLNKVRDEANGGWMFHLGPPKTPSSVRTIPFDTRCELAIKKQMHKKNIVAASRKAKTISGLEDLLFVTDRNAPLTLQVYNRSIECIVELINEGRDENNQFEPFSSHCFRHTFATRCFEADVSAKTVQEILGHVSQQITLDLYTHLLDEKRSHDLSKLSDYTSSIFEHTGCPRDSSLLEKKVVHIHQATMA